MSSPLSEAQKHAIRIVPRITAAMSVLGSGFILLSTLRNRKVVGRTLLAGMSLTDFLSSMSYVIGDVAYPEKNGGRGNQATCNGMWMTTLRGALCLCTCNCTAHLSFLALLHTAQGFLCNLQVGAALYSGFLAW